MTPKRNGKTLSCMVVRKEKVDVSSTFFQGDGKHKGLFVNGEDADALPDTNPDTDLDFRCFLINQTTQDRIVVRCCWSFHLFIFHILSYYKFDLSSLLQENRKLKFWFVKGADDFRKMTVTYEFFKELVRPGFFPRGKAVPIPFIFFLNVCTFLDLSCSYRLCWLHQESDEADAGPSIC